MKLLELLAEIHECDIYSLEAWEEYLSCFEEANTIQVKLERSRTLSREIPRRVCSGDVEIREKLDHSISHKIVTPERFLNEVRQENKMTGIVSGCFDLLHLGHVKGMWYAKESLTRSSPAALCVLTLPDNYIQDRKGASRPIMNVNERFRLITAIRYVDYAILLEEPDCLSMLECLKPDRYFKSKEDLEREVVRREAEIVQSHGGVLEVFADSVSNITTTTEIVEKIKSRFCAPVKR